MCEAFLDGGPLKRVGGGSRAVLVTVLVWPVGRVAVGEDEEASGFAFGFVVAMAYIGQRGSALAFVY